MKRMLKTSEQSRSEALCSRYILIFVVVASYWPVYQALYNTMQNPFREFFWVLVGTFMTLMTSYRTYYIYTYTLERPSEWVNEILDASLNYVYIFSSLVTINFGYVMESVWTVSIVTVFVNKTLLSSSSINLDAPLFITWLQCIVSYTICFGLSQSGGIPGYFVFPKGSPWKMDNMKKVIPLSLMFTLMIATNNLCLKYVGVSFYYIGRSLTTVFNVVFSYVLLSQRTSLKCITCCAFIVMGFFLGVDQESLLGSFSLRGTIFGVIGSLSLSLYSIYTKKVLPHLNQEVWLLSYYNNAYSILLFLPLMLMNGEFMTLSNYKGFDNWFFWVQMFVGGVCGFAIGYFTGLQIKVTSPLTHNISGTAKACAQTVIATQWYNESKNLLWWSSNVVILISSAFYARFKQMEMEEKSKRPVPEEKKSLV